MRAGAVLALAVWVAAACSTTNKEEEVPESGPAAEIVVEGNKELKTADLLAAVKNELLSFRKNGHRAADVDDAAFMMTRRLHDEGFAGATVETRLEPSDEDIRRVVFHVDEGPRARLGTVTFEGVKEIPEEKLKPLFEFQGEGVLGTERPYYRESEIDEALSGVKEAYRIAGYLRVRVGPARLRWNDARTSVDVAVPVVEGRRYVVRTVTVEVDEQDATGGPGKAELEARAREKIEKKPYYVHAAFEAAAAVRGALYEDARLLAEVESEAKIDLAAEKAGNEGADVPVDVSLRVKRGPRLRIARIDVRGNDLTDTGFMLDQSGLVAGVLLKQSLLDAAMRNLYGTGLFRTVKIKRTVLAEEGAVRDTQLLVDVTEAEPKSVDFEIGFGTYELLRGGIRYRDRNLFGIGRDFEARTYASFRTLGADIRLRDNYLLGRDNVVEVGGTFEIRQEPSFDTTSELAEVSVRHLFDLRTSLRPGYRWKRSNATDVRINVPIPADQKEETAVTTGPFVDFRYDGRDNPLIPTSGLFAEAGVAWSSPALGADLDYVGFLATLSTFVALGDDTVLALGAGFETRHILDSEDTLPIQERLFLGGESSVRSFGESELGPTDSRRHPIGGLTSLQGHVEVRQRLVADLYGAVFYDVGTIGVSSFDFRGPYGHAVGLGLRYYFPVGPVRLDFGYNPGRRFADDENWALNLSFGFSF